MAVLLQATVSLQPRYCPPNTLQQQEGHQLPCRAPHRTTSSGKLAELDATAAIAPNTAVTPGGTSSLPEDCTHPALLLLLICYFTRLAYFLCMGLLVRQGLSTQPPASLHIAACTCCAHHRPICFVSEHIGAFLAGVEQYLWHHLPPSQGKAIDIKVLGSYRILQLLCNTWPLPYQQHYHRDAHSEFVSAPSCTPTANHRTCPGGPQSMV